MNRRSFLQLSAAALVSRPTLAAQSRKVFLFADWFHVNKGELAVTLDPARITADGKKLIETYARDLNKKFDQSRHGFKRVSIPNGIRIVPEVAEKTQPWLRADGIRERSISGASVIFDEGRYRCWYNAQLQATETKFATDQGRAMEVSGSALAYAESKDGVTWTRPSFGILSYKGSKDNNLVSPDNVSSSIFRDNHGPKEERYKGFHFGEISKEGPPNTRYGLYGISSPDGYHWTKNPKPLVRYFCDTVNVPSWDPGLGKYVGFFRHHLNGRSISYAETEDFWNWPMPQPLFYSGPMDSPAEDYYTNCYTRYPDDPSLRLLFPAMYHHDTDLVDVRMALSRDGRGYQWSSLDPVIRNGASGAWDAGSIYANPELLQLPDGRLALPYLGYNTTHNEVWFKYFYGDYPSATGVAWATWKDARLAGIQADTFGEFTTTSAQFDAARVEINARTSRVGSIEVELRQSGNPIEGYTFADCVPFRGDEVWADCRWKEKDTSALRGKRIELGVRMHSAKIFAYRFV